MKAMYFFTLLPFIIVTNAYSQLPDWSWAKSGGGTSNELVQSMKTDGNGNIYISGRFQSPTITFGNITLTNAASNTTLDFFIVKYDSTGNVLWAKNGGGANQEEALAINIDSNNDLYVTGCFSSDSIIIDDTTLIKSGAGNEFFLLKYNSLGVLQWAKSTGILNGGVVGNSIDIDNFGNIIVSGTFVGSTIIFDSVSADNQGISAAIFIVKFNPNGEALWVKNASSTSSVNGGIFVRGINSDSQRNVYISGFYYAATVNFDSIVINNNGTSNGFLAKYDEGGAFLWVKNIVGSNSEIMYSMSSDNNDHLYITGSYSSPNLAFDSITIINQGSQNGFIAKYNSSGDVLWAKNIGGSGYDESYSITTYNNDVFITGLNASPMMVFGTDTLFNNGGIANLFIAKYDSLGNVVWTKNEDGNGSNSCTAITTNNLGEIYIGGLFENSSIFSLGSSTLTNTESSTSDVFVAKLSSVSVLGMHESINPNIIVSPNPSNGLLNFNNLKRDNTIEIFDLAGRPIYKTISQTRFCNIDLTTKDKGIYFYRITTEKEQILQGKFILQ